MFIISCASAVPATDGLLANPKILAVPAKSTALEMSTPTAPLTVDEHDSLMASQSKAHPQESSAPWWRTPEWWTVVFTGWLTIFTLGLAIYTARLWGATRRLVEGAEDTAERQLRAYVFVKEVSASRS
jgi:hypothetical protein